MKTIKGMFWHCHHDRLCEYVYDYQGRVEHIKKYKSKGEIKTRLKLFKKVKGKLPKEFIKAWKKYQEGIEKYWEAKKKYLEGREKYKEAWEKYKGAWEKYMEAWEKYKEAEKKFDEAEKKYKPQFEKLHKKECGCKEWNGKEMIFK